MQTPFPQSDTHFLFYVPNPLPPMNPFPASSPRLRITHVQSPRCRLIFDDVQLPTSTQNLHSSPSRYAPQLIRYKHTERERILPSLYLCAVIACVVFFFFFYIHRFARFALFSLSPSNRFPLFFGCYHSRVFYSSTLLHILCTHSRALILLRL